MLCDPSHICGNREGLRDMAQQAADLDYNGLIIESHHNPACALSDAQQQITPEELATLLASIEWRSKISQKSDYSNQIEALRGTIDRLDEQIFSLFAERMNISEQIGALKQSNNLAILQSGRWGEVVERVLAHTHTLNLSDECVRSVLESIHLESIERQKHIIHNK
jgi:chorismate mutase